MESQKVVRNSGWKILLYGLVAGIATAFMMVGSLHFPQSFGMLVVDPVVLIIATIIGVFHSIFLWPIAFYALEGKDLSVVQYLIVGMMLLCMLAGILMRVYDETSSDDDGDFFLLYMLMIVYWIGALVYAKRRM